MRINPDPQLPLDSANLTRRLTDIFRALALQINSLSEGRISGLHTALAAAPTTGQWAQGDFIRNSAPTEAGSAGSKYVVFGWVCVAGGAPGTWRQVRNLTGN